MYQVGVAVGVSGGCGLWVWPVGVASGCRGLSPAMGLIKYIPMGTSVAE